LSDPRWDHLAEIITNYSTSIKAGDKVLISIVEMETFPLARAIFSKAVQAGAYPWVEFHSAYFERDMMHFGSTDQNAWVPEIQVQGIDIADVYISLRGARNPFEFANLPKDNFISRHEALGKIAALRTEKTRWVITRVPTESFAQQASISLDEAMEMYFEATLRDWFSESKSSVTLLNKFQIAETVRITGLETDITFSTKGRTYCLGDGHINMPDGEIFTSPIEDSVEGSIYFEYPGIFYGQKVEGIRLVISGGIVREASAEKNEALLHELLNMDQGARRIGEFAIGTNPAIKKFYSDHFFDEKIAGTVHFALGRAYSSCGGTNYSALHWDIVKDLRKKGAIFLDSQIVFKDGSFLI
jgi:aminopeptidase